MLFGRDRELAAIGRLIDEARTGRGSALVLCGPPGIGKTALLRAATERADGFRVLRTTGIESETGLPFAALHLLLAPVLDRVAGLPGPQMRALRGAFGLAEPPSDDTRFLVGLALLTLFGELADHEPVLCVVDDTHWLDGPSSAALAFAARRLGAEHVAMLFAARDEDGSGTAALFGLPALTPRELDTEEARAVVAAHSPGLTAGARQRVIEDSAGNPLALRELASGLGESSRHADVPPTALRASAAVTRTFRRQLSELPTSTGLLAVVAAADRSGSVDTLMAAARSLGCELPDLAAAVRAGVLVVDEAVYAFRHPLIRSTAYQDASVTDRADAHRALGDALAAAADSAYDAPDPAATWHRALAATGPDADLSRAMERAADNAWARGGGSPDAYRLAARLNPELSDRARLLTRAAQTAIVAGETDRATELSASAAELTDNPRVRAALAMVDATAENFRGHPRRAAHLLVAGAEGLVTRSDDASGPAPGFTAAPETGLAPTLLAIAAGYAWFSGDANTLRRAATLAGRCAPDTAVGAAISGLSALTRAETAEEPFAAAFAALSEFITRERERPSPALIIRMFAAYCARIVGDDEAADDLGEAESSRCRAQGTVSALPDVLTGLAHAQLACGRHRDAEATAAEALAFAREVGQTHVIDSLGSIELRVAAIAGDEERCRRITVAHDRLAEDPALGLLELGLGRFDDALARLETVANRPGAYRTSLVLALPDLVEAAVRTRQPERAVEPLARFLAWAESAPAAWTRAVALRSRALLPDAPTSGAASGMPSGTASHTAPDTSPGTSDTERLFLAALDQHATATRPFEYARTELVFGEWLRRARRRVDARRQLRSAEGRFARLGATPWAARARAELRAAGEGDVPAKARETASALDSLTARELHVVRLAADGASNQEIASRLFLSGRTVEYHLYKAYPKLGVSSRRELRNLDLPRLP